MTIKARKAAATMLSELEAETDAIRASISDELMFSNNTILMLSETREEELRALDAEFAKRKAAVKKTYQELIRNEERRIALYKAQLEKLDGPEPAENYEAGGSPTEPDIPVVKTLDPMIGHNSRSVEVEEDKAA